MNKADAILRWLKRHKLLVGPLVAFVVFVNVVASIELTGLTPFCGTCHSMWTVYGQWEKSSHASPRFSEQVGCSDCHVRDGVIGLVQDHLINGNLQLFAEVTHSGVPARPIVVGAMYDARCIACHCSVITRDDELADSRLPEPLKKIGLVVPHRNHYELRDFTPDEHKELDSLRLAKRNGKQRERYERLQQIEKGNCAQCHSKEVVAADGTISLPKDRGPHLEQPMTCIACHKGVVHVHDHGIYDRPIPSRKTCAGCHDGDYHGKLGRIFPVDCDSGTIVSECLKCHPKSPEALRALIAER